MEFYQLPFSFFLHLAHFLNAYDLDNLTGYFRLEKVNYEKLIPIHAQKFHRLHDLKRKILNNSPRKIAKNLMKIEKTEDPRFCRKIYNIVTGWKFEKREEIFKQMDYFPEELIDSLIKAGRISDQLAEYIILKAPIFNLRLSDKRYDFRGVYNLRLLKESPIPLRNFFRFLKEEDKNNIYDHLREQLNNSIEDDEIIENFFTLLLSL